MQSLRVILWDNFSRIVPVVITILWFFGTPGSILVFCAAFCVAIYRVHAPPLRFDLRAAKRVAFVVLFLNAVIFSSAVDMVMAALGWGFAAGIIGGLNKE